MGSVRAALGRAAFLGGRLGTLRCPGDFPVPDGGWEGPPGLSPELGWQLSPVPRREAELWDRRGISVLGALPGDSGQTEGLGARS